MKDQKVTIILADDHPLMRKGLKDIIEEQDGWSVIGEAGDGEQTLELINKLQPAIVIMDIEMPKLNGLEVAKIVQQKNLTVNVIILTMYNNESLFNRAMDLGVSGYVIKDSAAREIIDSIKTVAEGKYYVSPSLSSFLVKNVRLGSNGIKGISKLTTTERKILKMISENMTTKDIARELFISTRTVETHRTNICQKLDLHGTNALLKYALEHQQVL